MGMFDYVYYQGKVHQTKDFDCLMDEYYIENGRLFSAVGHTEDLSPATKWKKENPNKELPKELQGILGMYGCISFIETGRKDMNFHGFLNFYGDAEYNAKFTDGNLVSIEVVPEQP